MAPDETQHATTQATVASGLNVLAGIWLVISPSVLDYSDESSRAWTEIAFGPVWNQVVLGVCVAVLAVARVSAPARFESLSWVNAVLGLWLVVSPFVLLDGEVADAVRGRILANSVVVGVLIVALAAWSALSTRRTKA